jgi:hypothetical protein
MHTLEDVVEFFGLPFDDAEYEGLRKRFLRQSGIEATPPKK